MPYTLAEMAKVEPSPLRKVVMLNLYRYSDLLALIPFFKASSLSSIVVRTVTLPTVSWRQVNGTVSESMGTTEQVTEGVYGVGGDITFDRVFDLVKSGLIEDPKKTQTKMKLKAVAYEFNNKVINGDHAISANEPEGLNKRIGSYLPSTQQVATASASYDPTADSAHEHHLIDKLHEIIEVAGIRGSTDVITKNGRSYKRGAILLNHEMKLGIGKVLRRLSLLDTTQDNFGRSFDLFDNVPLVDVGVQRDLSTEIIGKTYGAGSDETRIFAVRFAEDEGDDGFAAIQLNTPDLYDPVKAGETSTLAAGTPGTALRMDWWVGFCGWGSRYAARLTGVQATSWT